MDSLCDSIPPTRQDVEGKPRKRPATSSPSCRSSKSRCIDSNVGEKPSPKIPSWETDGICNVKPRSINTPEELIESPESLSNDHLKDFIFEHLGPCQSARASKQSMTQLGSLSLLSDTALMGCKDLEFLKSQGCFSIPGKNALNLFFKQYFLHIHPLLPILDEVRFWKMHRSGSPVNLIQSGQVSLLLLYGILYTSASYVSRNLIQSLGFSDIHEAKEVFHTRATLLYDSKFERSSISISQAALLLSHCYLAQPPESFKHVSSIWLAIAIEKAKEAGAPDYNSTLLRSQPNTIEMKQYRQTLKRLWWCCIIRDRIMPLAARKSIIITRSVFDFENNPGLDMSDFSEEIQYSRHYSQRIKLELVQTLIKLAELCVILTDILSFNYNYETEDVQTAIQEAEQALRIRDCRTAMQKWFGSWNSLRLDENIKSIHGDSDSSLERFSILCSNVVIMYYHSAIISLCHQEMLIFGPASLSMDFESATSGEDPRRQQVQNATSRTVQCLVNLVRLRLAHLIPLSVVAIATFPLALQIVDLKISSTRDSQSKPNRDLVVPKQQETDFLGIIEAMQMCRPRFSTVGWILNCIRASVESFDGILFSNAGSWDSKRPLHSWLNNWTDIAQHLPELYLSFATLIDLSLSNGQLPAVTDLPVRLKSIERARRAGSNVNQYAVLPESINLEDIDILNQVHAHWNGLWNYEGKVSSDVTTNIVLENVMEKAGNDVKELFCH